MHKFKYLDLQVNVLKRLQALSTNRFCPNFQATMIKWYEIRKAPWLHVRNLLRTGSPLSNLFRVLWHRQWSSTNEKGQERYITQSTSKNLTLLHVKLQKKKREKTPCVKTEKTNKTQGCKDDVTESKSQEDYLKNITVIKDHKRWHIDKQVNNKGQTARISCCTFDK